MKNIEKYLGTSKLTTEYEDNFFDDEFIESRDLQIERILKYTSNKIVFLTSEKILIIGYTSSELLKKFRKKPRVFGLKDPVFSTAKEAIEYFENNLK
jgi:hypothetical protein